MSQPPPPPYGQYGQPAYAQPGWVSAPSDGWMAPQGLTPEGRRLASFGRRFLGLLVDLLIWAIPLSVLYVLIIVLIVASAPSEGEEAGAGFALGILGIYGVLFVVAFGVIVVEAELLYRRGRTWGMGAAKLRVVDVRTRGPISRGKAWGRTAFARFISGQVCGFGFWWALFDNRNRTLHDLVAGTVVIDEQV